MKRPGRRRFFASPLIWEIAYILYPPKKTKYKKVVVLMSLETEKSTNQSFKRAGDTLSNKMAGLGVLATKKIGAAILGKALLVIKALVLKLLVIIGFKFVIVVGITLFAGTLLSGLLRGASQAAEIGYYQRAALRSIAEMREPEYLKRYVVPWGLLEAFDISANDAEFTGKRFAELLAPIVEYGPYGISRVNAWNGEYIYVYVTVTSIDSEGNETSTTVLERIDFVENWTRLDNALTERLNRPITETDRTVVLAMGVTGTFNEPEITFLPVGTAPVMFGEYAFPVAGPSTVTSPFGAFRIVNGRSGIHRGLDIGARMGTPLVAVRDSTVERAFWGAAGGNMVVLRAADGMRYLYAHLQYLPRLQQGQQLERGQPIGRVGSTGFSTGPHLHIEFILPDGTRVDPAPHLGVQ